jgi:hypothetical protein
MSSQTTENPSALSTRLTKSPRPRGNTPWPKLYGAARQHFSHRESERVYFLGIFFDGNREPIFMDWCHIPSAANRQVAQAMAAKISPPKAP